MKKYIFFTVFFIAAYFILQIGTGMILTVLYIPSDPWESSMAAASQVEIGRTAAWLPSLLYILLSIVIAYGGMKLVDKRMIRKD
ncbi:hypothetical protein ACDX78_21295 [Virgibacillus oceani]